MYSSRDSYAGYRILDSLLEATPTVSKQAARLFPEECKSELDDRLRTNLLDRMLARYLLQQIALGLWDGEERVVNALPASWRHSLARQGIAVDGLTSWLRWRMLQLRLIVAAFRRAINLTRYSIAGHRFAVPETYWVADNFTAEALPAAGSAPEDNPGTLTAFLTARFGGAAWAVVPGGRLERQVPLSVTAPHPFPPLGGIAPALRFLAGGLVLAGRAALGWLLGSGDAAVLAADAVEARYMEAVPGDRLAAWHVTTNSRVGARPPWAAVAERRGVKTAMVFYSVNHKPLHFKGQLPCPLYPYYPMLTWPRYFVWDRVQADWIAAATGRPAEFIELGYIPYADKPATLAETPARAVAVFDIPVARDVVYARSRVLPGYYTPSVLRGFLTDIQEVLASADCTMIIKAKRDIGASSHPAHVRLIEELRGLPNVVVADANISAMRISKACRATISIPFSSPAVAAAMAGKPAAFYDSADILVAGDTETHGLPLLSDKAALIRWVDAICSQEDNDEAPQRSLL